MQATRKAALSAVLVRLAGSSRLQVSAFLLSLVFGSCGHNITNNNQGADAPATGSGQRGRETLTDSGSVLDIAVCVESILPSLVNMGMVDQQFSWPLLRVLSSPASCDEQREAAALLLSHFHASNEQARAAAEYTNPNDEDGLSEAAQAHIKAFIRGQAGKAREYSDVDCIFVDARVRALHWVVHIGYKLRVRCHATPRRTKKHRQDHGRGSPGRNIISEAAYERAVAELNSHSSLELH